MGLLQTDLGISAGIAGWISGVFSLMGIVLAFPAVGIIRKWGALKGGLVSVAVTLVGSVVGLFAPNEYVLLVSRIIEGFWHWHHFRACTCRYCHVVSYREARSADGDLELLAVGCRRRRILVG